MSRLVLLLLLLATALPASAKMPPFEMEVELQGDTVHVEVTITGDESLIHDFDSSDLDGLLAVLPADQVDEEGRPQLVLGGGTDVPLSRVGRGIYQGSVELEPGRWAVVPFPDVRGALRGSLEGWYPATVEVEVKDEAIAIWPLAALGVVMAIAWGFRAAAGVRPK